MPKTKKKFIDRKNAVTFHLVHRSQQDPLITDETAPQHVLVPAVAKHSKEATNKRKEEQRKYGILFDDDYDYLQHLKESSTLEYEWQHVPERTKTEKNHSDQVQDEDDLEDEKAKVTKIYLPSSVFASEVEEEIGMLNKAAPQSGLQLELDPDIVAAMDEDFDFDNPENELEDNFVELANVEDSNLEDEEYDSDDVSSNEYISEEEGENDDVRSLSGSEMTFGQEETKSRFTNYSMSSSVIRRNDQLTLLDGRFEKMFADYDDSEIGALDCEEIEGHIHTDSDILKEFAKEFEKQKSSLLHDIDKTQNILERISSDSEDSDNLVKIEVENKDRDKWDCESILSTYSNIYNHPKLIPDMCSSKHIRVSRRTGVPLDVLGNNTSKLTYQSLAKLDATNRQKDGDPDGSESVVSVLSTLSIRTKDETPEQRKERKRMLKELRKERRMEKKANTIAFKEEKKRQEKVLLNNKLNQQGSKIM